MFYIQPQSQSQIFLKLCQLFLIAYIHYTIVFSHHIQINDAVQDKPAWCSLHFLSVIIIFFSYPNYSSTNASFQGGINFNSGRNIIDQYIGLFLYWEKKRPIYWSRNIIQGESFHWNLTFAILLMADLLNLNSAYHHIFRNLSTIAYTIGIQNSLIFNSLNLTNFSRVAKFNSVYIFIMDTHVTSSWTTMLS